MIRFAARAIGLGRQRHKFCGYREPSGESRVRNCGSVSDTSFVAAAYTLGMTNFDQSQHPRNAAGTSKGGQFAQKQNSAPEAELPAENVDAETVWRTAMAREAELERQLEAARLAKVRAGADVIESLVRAKFPDATEVRFQTWGDWDTPDDESSVSWAGAYDASGDQLASGSDLEALPINEHGHPFLDYTHDFIGYKTWTWEQIFELAGDGDIGLDGDGEYIIRFKNA